MRLLLHVLVVSFALSTAPAAAKELVFADWTAPLEDTKGMLLVTGGDAGFVKPKGCFAGVGGGLYRPGFEAWLGARTDLPPHVWLSTGDVLTTLDEAGVAPPEESLETLRKTGYSAVGLGRGEIDVLGVPEEGDHALPWVATNLEVFETGQGPVARARIVEVGGIRVGVLAVTQHRPSLAFGSLARGTIVTEDPLPAIERELANWKSRPDYVVVLAALSQQAVRRLAPQLEGVDLVVASAALVARPQPQDYGSTKVFWIGGWGRFLGRIQLAADATEPLAVELIEVGRSFPIDPETGSPRGEDSRSAALGR